MNKPRVKLQGYIDPKIHKGFIEFKESMGITSDSYGLNQIIGSFLNIELERIPETSLERVMALFDRVSILESKVEYIEDELKTRKK